MKEIDINTWYRKDYFLFYKSFTCSLFNLSIETDATVAFKYCKKNNISFFIFCLYAFLKAANEVPQFRHRLIGDKVFDTENLTATTPIMLPNDENHQFTMVNCPYVDSFEEFSAQTKNKIAHAKSGVTPDKDSQIHEGLICLNCMPWFSFTGGAHAFLDPHQTMTIINWGKIKENGNKLILPYFMQLNHMFIDGYHVGQFTERLDYFFAHPEKI